MKIVSLSTSLLPPNLVLYHGLVNSMAWRHLFETVSLAPPSGHTRDRTSWVSNLLLPLSHLSRILQTLWSVQLKQSEKFKQTQEHQSCLLALILIFLPLTSIKFLWTHASYLTSTCGSVRNLKVSASGSLRAAIFFLDTSFNLVVLAWIISAPLVPQFPAPSHFSLSASLRVFVPPVGRESVAAAPPHQMGHCQEVMRGKHLLLRRTPLLHFQPFDTTYAGCTYKTKWPWREQQWAMAYSYECLALGARVSQWGVMFGITHLYMWVSVLRAARTFAYLTNCWH